MVPAGLAPEFQDNHLYYVSGRELLSLPLPAPDTRISVCQLEPTNIAYPGVGVFATAPIPKGTALADYAGIERHIEVADVNPYTMEVNDAFCVDAMKRGNITRFVNDARDPRIPGGFRRINVVADVVRVWLTPARRDFVLTVRYTTACDVAPGDELLVSYGEGYAMHMHPAPWREKCAIVVEGEHPVVAVEVKQEPVEEENEEGDEQEPNDNGKRTRSDWIRRIKRCPVDANHQSVDSLCAVCVPKVRMQSPCTKCGEWYSTSGVRRHERVCQGLKRMRTQYDMGGNGVLSLSKTQLESVSAMLRDFVSKPKRCIRHDGDLMVPGDFISYLWTNNRHGHDKWKLFLQHCPMLEKFVVVNAKSRYGPMDMLTLEGFYFMIMLYKGLCTRSKSKLVKLRKKLAEVDTE
jgi:hypothetical protein